MNIYIGLILVSLFCMSGDSPDFTIWCIWELFWTIVLIFSFYKIWRIEHE